MDWSESLVFQLVRERRVHDACTGKILESPKSPFERPRSESRKGLSKGSMAEFALDLFGFGAKTASTSLVKGNTGRARVISVCARTSYPRGSSDLIFRYCPSSLTVTSPSHRWCERKGLFSEDSDCRGRCRHGEGPCRAAQAVRVRRRYRV